MARTWKTFKSNSKHARGTVDVFASRRKRASTLDSVRLAPPTLLISPVPWKFRFIIQDSFLPPPFPAALPSSRCVRVSKLLSLRVQRVDWTSLKRILSGIPASKLAFNGNRLRHTYSHDDFYYFRNFPPMKRVERFFCALFLNVRRFRAVYQTLLYFNIRAARVFRHT